ncbi:MAG: NF038122 family metalloprotease [Proteobacteria bacterium]|nr:NF038122 family metalloprotease [Pseudomonadota bacterium]
MKKLLACGVAASVLAAAPANAGPTINLIDLGGVTGSQAEQGFRIAAAYWANILTNNVTINLGVGFSALPTGVIGSTGSTRADYSVANWESRVNATKSNSAIDQNIVLPTLTAGGASFITNGVNPVTGNDDLTTLRYDNGATASSKTLYLNTAVIKAIGGNTGLPASTRDGNVTFSSNFAFDFNPTDGINPGTFDFIGVAIHEIGHALGFVSGVDFLDVYGEGPGNSPNEGKLGYSLNDTSIYSALDMFRYSNDPNNIAPGNGPSLDLSVNGNKYFSIDGGATALFGNFFSNGRYNGSDGQQASHWRDTAGCQIGNGIMDPTFCYGQTGYITGLDLAAYDAMGWNLSTNALTYGTTSTGTIYRSFANTVVPEPATWAMMIMGFGLMGAAMRRNRKVTTRVRFA